MLDKLDESDEAAIERVRNFLRNLSLAQDRIATVTTRQGEFNLTREDLELVVLAALRADQ